MRDLGTPTATTGYHLCLYDESAVTPTLAARATIPAGGACAGAPCWRNAGGTLRYRNPARTPHGISKVVIRAGDAGRAKIVLEGKGARLPPLPILPLALPLRVQLQADDATCFEAVFGNTGVARNDAATFVAYGN
jgi:hypothetical protein